MKVLCLKSTLPESVIHSQIKLAKQWDDQYIKVQIPYFATTWSSANTTIRDAFQELLQVMVQKEQILMLNLEHHSNDIGQFKVAQDLGILASSSPSSSSGISFSSKCPKLHLTVCIHSSNDNGRSSSRSSSTTTNMFVSKLFGILQVNSSIGRLDTLVLYMNPQHSHLLRSLYTNHHHGQLHHRQRCSSLSNLKIFFFNTRYPSPKQQQQLTNDFLDLLTTENCNLTQLEISSWQSFSTNQFLLGLRHRLEQGHHDSTIGAETMKQFKTSSCSSLQRLGLCSMGLTNKDTDDLMCCLGQLFPNLRVLDLFNNKIQSYVLSNFGSLAPQQYPQRLQELHLYQNPCGIHPCTPDGELLHMYLKHVFLNCPSLYKYGWDKLPHIVDTTNRSVCTTNLRSTNQNLLVYLGDWNRSRVRGLLQTEQSNSSAFLPKGVWPLVLEKMNHMLPTGQRQASVVFTILQESPTLFSNFKT